VIVVGMSAESSTGRCGDSDHGRATEKTDSILWFGLFLSLRRSRRLSHRCQRQERQRKAAAGARPAHPESPAEDYAIALEWHVAIRLIAIDIDGTLLDGRSHLPEANSLAIQAAVARGVEVALVTGRRFTFALPVAEQIPAPLTMIVNNGALIRSKDGHTFERLLLPHGVARRLLVATQEFRLGTLVLFDRPRENQVIYELLDWSDPLRSGYWRRNIEYLAQVAPLEDCLTEDPIQVMFTGGFAHMREVAQRIQSLDFAQHYSVATTEYESKDFTLVDVLHPHVSKGAALRQWSARQGYSRESVMAIGDNWNDREMLEFAGLPVVMGNAVPDLRADGWHLTGTNDEAGVAQAIGRFVL
jgi:Cof subfamily protein (haloacid dehalogenase superfamily)